MVVAVTYEKGQVFQHFGHTEYFKIYETSETEVLKSEILSTEGQGHSALAAFLKERKVNTLICGGLGAGAQMALQEMGIRVFPGITGNADEAVRQLVAGTLACHPGANCHHHQHHEGDCGHAHCAGHHCAGN